MINFFRKYFLLLILFIIAGCAYYNTFFNAKENYQQAQEKQKKIKSDKLPSDVKNYYNNAIKKCWKLIDFYGDSSKYADDALVLIGKSHYHLGEYIKAERVLEQFLLKYRTSEYVPEAKLWLARTYIQLEKDDNALEVLDKLFETKVSKNIAAYAFNILGDLYFKQENYEKAIENFEKCVEITSDEEIEGSALFLIGESFFNLEEYENAIYNYEKLTKLDVPPLKEFEALSQVVNALNKLEKYEESGKKLKTMLRQLRFKPQFSIIETKLANIFEYQGDNEFAMEHYLDVIKKYPKTEGAALSSFYLGQLFEFEYGQYDSAKVYYENVKKHFSKLEAVEEANQKAKILSEYIKIRNQLRKDHQDYYRLTIGDSSIVDSVVVEGEEEDEQDDQLSQKDQFEKNDLFEQDKQEDKFGEQDNAAEQGDSLFSEFSQKDNQTDSLKTKKVKQKKIAVSRSAEEVEGSLLKNSFALAEFFLVKYQQYDSAAANYKSFINHFSDTLLTPKAHYSLYYIFKNIKYDSLSADSIKAIILDQYMETVYGLKLSGREEDIETKDMSAKSDYLIRAQYLQAEDYVNLQKYDQAIKVFNEIALQDSGSLWAQKARYATAYIYEKCLKDTNNAIESYTVLVKEYPNSKFGKVAKNKIKEPVIEEKEPDKEDKQQKTESTIKDIEEKEVKQPESESEEPEMKEKPSPDDEDKDKESDIKKKEDIEF